MDLRTETDPERLRQVALLLEDEVKHLAGVVNALSKRLSDALGEDVQQQVLNLIEAKRPRPEVAPKPPKPSEPRKARADFGPTPQPDLEHRQVIFELPEDARVCPECGEALVEAGFADTCEVIDVIDIKYVVKQVEQKKYGCTGCPTICRAPGPDRAIAGGRYGLDFGVKVAIDKYEHHVPLARQARIAAGFGLNVGRNTLYNQIERMADELSVVSRAIISQILACPVIGLDQTGWPNLDQKGKKRWQVWCLTAPNLVAHVIRGDKGAKTFNDIVGDFDGVIVCDALSSHLAARRARAGPYKLAGCWAHVRRKFAEAEADFPAARTALIRIRELYDIDERAADDERLALRQVESKAVLEQLQSWLIATRMPKTTSLGAAIRYALNDWHRLTVFVDDAPVPLDNNATERGLRGIAIGRRVHFGSKSRRGTQVAAIFYTLIESAKAEGVPARGYLTEAVRSARAGFTLTPAGYRAYLEQVSHTVGEYASGSQRPPG